VRSPLFPDLKSLLRLYTLVNSELSAQASGNRQGSLASLRFWVPEKRQTFLCRTKARRTCAVLRSKLRSLHCNARYSSGRIPESRANSKIRPCGFSWHALRNAPVSVSSNTRRSASLTLRAGLHRTYVSDIERGGRNVSLDNIQSLARALEISISDLFIRSGV